MEVPKCFLFCFVFFFERLGFFCGLYNQVFFLINRRLDDGVERYFGKPPIFKVEWHS